MAGTAEDFYGTGAIMSTAEDAQQVTIQTNGGQTIQVGQPLEEKESEATINIKVDGKEVKVPEGVNLPPEVTTQEETKADVKKGDETPTGDKATEEKSEGVAQEIAKANETATVIENDLTAKGVDFKTLENEFLSNGSFTPESLASLEKAGYPKQVVDAYITGLQATAEQYHTSVINIAGGQEAYTKATSEIKAMGDKYVQAYNQAINSGNLVVIESMLTNAKSRMTSRLGSNNPSLLGTATGAPQAVGNQPFATQKAMIDAINDPKYRSDTAYRRSVEARVEATAF